MAASGCETGVEASLERPSTHDCDSCLILVCSVGPHRHACTSGRLAWCGKSFPKTKALVSYWTSLDAAMRLPSSC
eukprot:11387835-Alexandrium_andersonii.AAC.1